MKVFISWSKEPSKTVAKALNDWLPTVVQAVEPWMSEEGIPAGSRWHSQISNQLATTSFGIICLTPQNQHEPWLQFEAGALAKAVENRLGKEESSSESYVVPYLIGMAKSEVSGPLIAFQAVEANESETRKLVSDLNKALAKSGGKALTEETLEKSFKRAWPELKATLDTPSTVASVEPQRPQGDILTEILEVVRDTNRRVGESTSKDVLESEYLSAVARHNIRNYLGEQRNRTAVPPPPVSFTNTETFSLFGKEETLTKILNALQPSVSNLVDLTVKTNENALFLTIASTSEEEMQHAREMIFRAANRFKIQPRVM